MIIDDEPDILTYLTAVLEDSGYKTCTTDGAENVVDAVKRCQPDLILLDIMMPEKSGLSVYCELRQTPGIGNLPVALISGVEKASGILNGAFSDRIDNSSVAPPDGFIEKPIQMEKLIDVIAALLDLKGETRESSH
jgi:CheY-like chemotaxis protein